MDIENVVDVEINIEQIGPQGLSAYEIYKKNGGTLSEKDWLLSLRGDTGPIGPIGPIGEVSLEELKKITGSLEKLNTKNKDDLVSSINEVFDTPFVYYVKNISLPAIGGYPIVISDENQLIFNEIIDKAHEGNLNILVILVVGSTLSSACKLMGISSTLNSETNGLGIQLYQISSDIKSGQAISLNIYKNGTNCMRYESVGYVNSNTLSNILSKYLSKTNTTTYVPTASTHPATKGYVDQSIETLKSRILEFKMLVVTELPTEGISANTIYLVPKSYLEDNNIYYEFIYIEDKWEKIGDTKIDLNNYATKDYVNETAIVKTFNGSETDYEILTEEEKKKYDVAIVYTIIELTEEEIQLINSILGEENEIVIDMTELEVNEKLEQIIGGE